MRLQRALALAPRPLRVFNGGRFGASDGKVATLILGRSWFVAEEFEERELPIVSG